MNEQLANVAISQLPNLFSFLREQFKKENPEAPTPTEEELTAALNAAVASSVAKDDRWLAAHPE